VLRYEGLDKGEGQLGSCPGRRDVNGIIGNVDACNSGFHTPKNFSENYPQMGTRPQNFTSPGLGRKTFKDIGFMERQLLAGPASTSCSSILSAPAQLFCCQRVQPYCG
jgi:hypothetical protein